MGDATLLLKQWRAGDNNARNSLIDLMHTELASLAAHILSRDSQRNRLEPPDLVNESVLRLLKLTEVNWQDRAHFMSLAGITMRRVLVDIARAHKSDKRAGIDVTLSTAHLLGRAEDLDLLQLDDALTALRDVSAELQQIVELKFFAGLTNAETATVLGVSAATVKRKWRTARAWLLAHLENS